MSGVLVDVNSCLVSYSPTDAVGFKTAPVRGGNSKSYGTKPITYTEPAEMARRLLIIERDSE
jgi:hypothetical protein